MSSEESLGCYPTTRWEFFTNTKHLTNATHPTVEHNEKVWARVIKVNNKNTFKPVLPFVADKNLYQGQVTLPEGLWKRLGGKGIRVRLERTKPAKLQYYLLRLGYDGSFLFGTVLASIGVILSGVSSIVPAATPWSTVLGLLAMAIGLAVIRFKK